MTTRKLELPKQVWTEVTTEMKFVIIAQYDQVNIKVGDIDADDSFKLTKNEKLSSVHFEGNIYAMCESDSYITVND